jgi:maleate isomerase
VLSACVQMPAAAAIEAAQQRFGLPVVTASSCTVRQMLQALGLPPVVPGYGAALSA